MVYTFLILLWQKDIPITIIKRYGEIDRFQCLHIPSSCQYICSFGLMNKLWRQKGAEW